MPKKLVCRDCDDVFIEKPLGSRGFYNQCPSCSKTELEPEAIGGNMIYLHKTGGYIELKPMSEAKDFARKTKRLGHGVTASLIARKTEPIESTKSGSGSELAIWGNVWKHEQGFRSQYAYPKNLIFSSSMIPTNEMESISIIDKLSAYGVPLFFQVNFNHSSPQIPVWNATDGINLGSLYDLFLRRLAAWQNRKITTRIPTTNDRAMVGTTMCSVWGIHEGFISLMGDKRMFITPIANVEWLELNSLWQVAENKCTIRRLP